MGGTFPEPKRNAGLSRRFAKLNSGWWRRLCSRARQGAVWRALHHPPARWRGRLSEFIVAVRLDEKGAGRKLERRGRDSDVFLENSTGQGSTYQKCDCHNQKFTLCKLLDPQSLGGYPSQANLVSVDIKSGRHPLPFVFYP